MIDYLALLLVNMAAGFFILASYLLSGADETAARRWAAPFGAVALVALLGGLHMSFTWPLIGSYNCAFGEMSVLFGAFFAATALALAKEWNPAPMGFYGAFSGIAAIVVGAAIIRLKLTATPLLAGSGFIISGAVGVGILPALACRCSKPCRWVVAMLAIVAAIIWAVIGYTSYYKHLEGFQKYMPPAMVEKQAK